MNMVKRNLLTNSDNHQSFSLGQVAFRVNLVKIYFLTPSDLFLTFDPKLVIDLFAWLINAHKKKVVLTISEHVLRFSPV